MLFIDLVRKIAWDFSLLLRFKFWLYETRNPREMDPSSCSNAGLSHTSQLGKALKAYLQEYLRS